MGTMRGTGTLLTAEMLGAYGASQYRVAIFRAEWPDGMWPTSATVQRAHALGLDDELRALVMGSAEWPWYERVRALAGARYAQITEDARERLVCTCERRAEYDRVLAAALARYKRITSMALARSLRRVLGVRWHWTAACAWPSHATDDQDHDVRQGRRG